MQVKRGRKRNTGKVGILWVQNARAGGTNLFSTEFRHVKKKKKKSVRDRQIGHKSGSCQRKINRMLIPEARKTILATE